MRCTRSIAVSTQLPVVLGWFAGDVTLFLWVRGAVVIGSEVLDSEVGVPCMLASSISALSISDVPTAEKAGSPFGTNAAQS
jgi:hypothetical protein